MLNPVSHTVNIKWLLLYSCAPVTQTKHVFQWEMQQFSICAPRTWQALKATDNHRQRQFDYSWVVLKFSQSWTWGRSQRQLHAPSARHTLHPALSPLLTPYITPLTSRSSCYNPCVTSVLTEKRKKKKPQQPFKFISISLWRVTKKLLFTLWSHAGDNVASWNEWCKMLSWECSKQIQYAAKKCKPLFQDQGTVPRKWMNRKRGCELLLHGDVCAKTCKI